MRIITVKDEQELSAVVPQVFGLSSNATSAVSRAALQSLIEANPQLAGRTRVPAGTPIVIPDNPSVPGKEPDQSFVSAGPLGNLQSQVREALSFARSSFSAASDAAEQDSKESLAVLSSREFRAAAKNVDATALRQQINQDAKDARAQAAEDLKALDALANALAEFTKMVAPETGGPNA